MRVYISQEKLGHYPDLFPLNKIRLSLELVVLLQIRLKQKILAMWHLERPTAEYYYVFCILNTHILLVTYTS